jgi:hypothetical protein
MKTRPTKLKDMTPEEIAASDTHTRAEKLELLETMRHEALEKREKGDMPAAQADEAIGEIDSAIETVKREDEDTAGVALGRATSA